MLKLFAIDCLHNNNSKKARCSMRNTDYNQDEQFRQMLEQFLNRLMTVHGRSEEARFSNDGLQRAYDDQKKLRRSNFNLIHGDEPD
jgi:hypothetical protein